MDGELANAFVGSAAKLVVHQKASANRIRIRSDLAKEK